MNLANIVCVVNTITMNFYVPDIRIGIISSPISDHFFSMRLSSGDPCSLTDLKGNTAAAVILNADKKNRTIEYDINSIKTSDNARKGILYQALIDRSYQEKLIEVLPFSHFKKIVFVATDNASPQQPNYDRLEGILIRSCCQCETAWKPHIQKEVVTIDKVLSKKDIIVMDSSFNDTQSESKQKKNACFVGPEGGWSDNEQELFKQFSASKIFYSGIVYPAWFAGLAFSMKTAT